MENIKVDYLINEYRQQLLKMQNENILLKAYIKQLEEKQQESKGSDIIDG